MMNQKILSYISKCLLVLAAAVAFGGCMDDSEPGALDSNNSPYAVFRITGQVVVTDDDYPAGRPVAGAEVVVLNEDNDGNAVYVELFKNKEEADAKKDVTDAAGCFTVEVRTLPSMGYRFPLKVTADVIEVPKIFVAEIENYDLKQDDDYFYASDGRYYGTVLFEMSSQLVLNKPAPEEEEPEPDEQE
ncbi:carboxypeptidase-like regulatory domain-containing protein [Alistipes sp. OttesenSCG-928-B03]|nr:carboxypeptidase-like regulatory domain-containing protein [Alistipes sp. OttesenSCG-928-B03]